MKKTKITELLSSFSNSEIKRFKTFLNSPYCNHKPQFVKAFAALSEYHPYYENDNLTEEKIFAEMFNGKPYSYTMFKNALSDIYELAKQFLASEIMLKDKLGTKNLFLRDLFTRDSLKDLIEKEINIAEHYFENENFDPLYFEQYYIFKKNLSEYFSNVDQDRLEVTTNEEMGSFFNMVLNNLLKYALWFEANKIMLKSSDFRETMNTLVEGFYKVTSDKKQVNEIYYKILRLLVTYDEKYYKEIMEMLKDEVKYLNDESKRWVYQTLEPFLIQKVREGNSDYYRPQFELYKHCFETGLFNFDYAFAQGKLLVTVETAIRVNEIEWIENKVNLYRDKGPKEIREDYYNFNMSKILLAKGKNEDALNHLNKVNPELSLLKSMVRNMQMKVFYELGHFELAKSHIDSYRHYIAREQGFSENYKESVFNFLRIYNKLIDTNYDRTSEKLDDLEFDIRKTTNTILREWLKDKTAELNKGS